MLYQRATLTELEGKDWGPPTYDSGLVTRCHAARYKPIGDLSADELRMLLGQDIGTFFLLPLAIDRLLSGALELPDDLWPGALLNAACQVEIAHWAASPELFHALKVFVERALTTGHHPSIEGALRAFLNHRSAVTAMSHVEVTRELARRGLSTAALYRHGAPDASPRNVELEAAIGEAIDDLDRYEVYADWLLEKGEPRGELVQAQCRLEREGESPSLLERVDDLLKEHGARWLGPAAVARAAEVEWKRGFVHSLFVIDDERADSTTRLHTWFVDEVLKRPACAFVRSYGNRMVGEPDLVSADDGGMLSFHESFVARARFVERLRFELPAGFDFYGTEALVSLALRLPALRAIEVSESIESVDRLELPPHIEVVRIPDPRPQQ